MKTQLIFTFLIGISLTVSGESDFPKAEKTGETHGKTALEASKATLELEDLKRFVTRMTSAEFEGRSTGDPGERMATAYLASFMEGLDLQPAGDDSTFFQKFDFMPGMALKGANTLTTTVNEDTQTLKPGKQYQPLSFSSSGTTKGQVVFAGYGIEAKSHNSFEDLDVKGKWLIVFRGTPTGKPGLKRMSPLVSKAKYAKKLGAAGIIFIKAGHPQVGPELIKPNISVGPAKNILPALLMSDEQAAKLVGGTDELKKLFNAYDKEERTAGFDLPITLEGKIGLELSKDYGRNVLARLVVGEQPSKQMIVIGGHIDHLGFGTRGGSRAKGAEAQKLHPGADDNASGIAVLMELAQYFADQKKAGTLNLERDLLFAGWSGEEYGLYGSNHFIKQARKTNDKKIYPGLAAYINFDMIGRASQGLTLNGIASSPEWETILNDVKSHPDLKITPVPNPYVPSDATSFYLAGVPIIAAFTGVHDDYHTPRDTIDKIDFPGLLNITNYMKVLVENLSTREFSPKYVLVTRKSQQRPRVRIGIRMEDAENGGVNVTMVLDKSAAKKAGLRVKDIITGINGAEVTTMAELFVQIRKLKANKEYPISVKRDGEKVDMKISPLPR